MNIAVIRFSSLGDVVLTTAILQKLIKKFPDCSIDFITDRKFARLFYGDPRVRSVILYDISRDSPGYMVAFLKRLRREHYDLVIDAHVNPRSVIVTLLSRTGARRRLRKYSRQRRLMVKRHRVWHIPHAVERYLAAVDGVSNGKYRPHLYIDRIEEERIRAEIEGLSGKKRVVGIAPGAGRRTKVWDVEKTQRLVHSLAEKYGLFLILLGSSKDVELVNTICRPLTDGYLDLAGKTDFHELALYLKACDVVLTTDSGPMHVAVAVNTPVVALFGPTVCEFGFCPYDEYSITISIDLPCRPCSLHGTERCPLEHHRCMKEIEPDAIEKAILAVLESGKT